MLSKAQVLELPSMAEDFFAPAAIPFRNCVVGTPRVWDCLDENGKLISLRGYMLRSAEMDSSRLASVSKIEYLGFWRSLIE